MKHALRIGTLALAVGLSLAGCQLGDKVDRPHQVPNTFIEEGFPDENQTWLSDAVSFRYFGTSPDAEIIAYYTTIEPALFTWDNPGTGLLDTLWPGEPAYSEGQATFIDTLWFSDLGCWDPVGRTVTCEAEIVNVDGNLVGPDSVITFYDWERTENQTRTYQGLKDAYYRFSVRAVDEADGLDPAPARRHFLVLAATWPEIVPDRCPPRRDASPVERITFHGELGSLEPWQFLYSWMLTSDIDPCELCHTWTEWQAGVTEVSYAGLEPGATYTFRVRSAIERAGVQIESRGFAECEFTIRTK